MFHNYFIVSCFHSSNVTVEVIGKNLYYAFSEAPKPDVWIRFHFGMSGELRVLKLGSKEVRATTRLRLLNEDLGLEAHLGAMICEHGGIELLEEGQRRLGPDPLREDAAAHKFFANCRATKKSIGLVLMDQNLIAGVGNIFRAEVLFKSRLHPETPARDLSDAELQRVWFHCTDLLQRGFKLGSILTVDPEDAKVLGSPWTRRYVYNQSKCGVCGGRIMTWSMSSRTVYACATCQPQKRAGEGGGAGGPSASSPPSLPKGAKAHVPFVSHCAGEGPDTIRPEVMTVEQLKGELKGKGLPTTGRKAQLVERLTAAYATVQPEAPAAAEAAAAAAEGIVATSAKPEETPALPSAVDLLPAALRARASLLSFYKDQDYARIQPGTVHLGSIATAAEAALEKLQAGEKRNVEHVAQHDDAERALLLNAVLVGAVTAEDAEEAEAEEVGAKPDLQTPSPAKRKGGAGAGVGSATKKSRGAARANLAREFAAEVAHTGERQAV